MTLNPDSRNDPFKFRPNFDDRRSVMDGDFSDSDMDFFTEIVGDVDDSRLKARIADLVWLRQNKRDVSFALMAIDAYRQIPLDTEIWLRGGRECWQRALTLTLMLKTGAGNRLQEIEASIFEVLDLSKSSDGYRALWMESLLSKYSLGGRYQLLIAEKLKLLSCEFNEEGSFRRSRDYAEASAKWYAILGEDEKSIEMTIAVAEGWAKEAVARIEDDKSGYIVAAGFYENAIQVYRTIPRSQRGKYTIDTRITELHEIMSDAGKKAVGEMKETRTPGVDISDLVENARSSVSNKSIIDALKAFTYLSPAVKFTDLCEKAIKQIREFPLSAMFSGTYIDSDGRVIDKTSGVGFSEELTYKNSTVWATMIQNYSIHIGFVVQGLIIPALDILHVEHRITEVDFLTVVQQAPVVPPGRERLFAKALFAGYDKDYIVALHILIPQIEHLVRLHLKKAGCKTTTLNSNGIETENGLSTLVDLPEMTEVFGEDLSFEIKALFCDAKGANLRNQLAHGLLDERTYNSTHGVYAWWLGFKIVFNAFWNIAQYDNKNEAV